MNFMSKRQFFSLFWLFLVGSLMITNLSSAGDLQNQKADLENIKSQMKQSRQTLDSLRNIEQGIVRQMSNFEQQASVNKTVVQRLNNQLANIRQDMDNAKSSLDNSSELYTSARQRFIGNLKYYYFGAGSNLFDVGDEMAAERDAFTRLIYLQVLAGFDKEDMTRAAGYLEKAELQYTELVNQEQSVDGVRNRKKTEYTLLTTQKEKSRQDLSRLRRNKENESDRLITLSAEAQQMEDLVSRLENARRQRGRAGRDQFEFNTGNFANYKGGLMAPVRGKIITGFGWKTDKTTKLKSYSPGIVIKAKKNASVLASAPGVVSYIGNLRGYGNFIIIEHEDGFFSTYAGLDNIKVVANQLVDKGKILGLCSGGTVKFELRQGRSALDPVEWLAIDSLK